MLTEKEAGVGEVGALSKSVATTSFSSAGCNKSLSMSSGMAAAGAGLSFPLVANKAVVGRGVIDAAGI